MKERQFTTYILTPNKNFKLEFTPAEVEYGCKWTAKPYCTKTFAVEMEKMGVDVGMLVMEALGQIKADLKKKDAIKDRMRIAYVIAGERKEKIYITDDEEYIMFMMPEDY